MRAHRFYCVVTLMALIILTSSLNSQEWSQSQLEVWRTIRAQWEASKEQDATWPEVYLHPSFLGWSDDNPMPRNKASVQKWQRYEMETSKTLEQELSPVGIVVEGNVAIAHYYFSSAIENYKGERKTIHGRFTDILTKEGERWRFLAWRGGADPRWKE